MITHRFAEAAERRDGAAMAALFAEDVTYHTPTLTTDLHGKDLTLRYLAAGTGIVDDLEYTDQVSDDDRLILFWKGILDQREISGATVVASEAGGLIRDITVLQRPWGVTANFRDGILPALADAVPLPAWQLDTAKHPRRTPAQAPGSVQAAPFRWRLTPRCTTPCSPRPCTASRMSRRITRSSRASRARAHTWPGSRSPGRLSSTGIASSTATSCKESTTTGSTATDGSPTRPSG